MMIINDEWWIDNFKTMQQYDEDCQRITKEELKKLRKRYLEVF